MRNGMEIDKEPASTGAAGGLRSKLPFPEPQSLAMSRGADTESDSDESDGDAETFRGRRPTSKTCPLQSHDAHSLRQTPLSAAECPSTGHRLACLRTVWVRSHVCLHCVQVVTTMAEGAGAPPPQAEASPQILIWMSPGLGEVSHPPCICLFSHTCLDLQVHHLDVTLGLKQVVSRQQGTYRLHAEDFLKEMHMLQKSPFAIHGRCACALQGGFALGTSDSGATPGKRQRVSPHDDAFHFFNRADADKEGQRKPHLEEAAMALLLLDVHSAPGKVDPALGHLPMSHHLHPP